MWFFSQRGISLSIWVLCLLRLKETMTTIFVSISSPLDAFGSICSIFTNEVNFSSLFSLYVEVYLGEFLFFKVKEKKNLKVVLDWMYC